MILTEVATKAETGFRDSLLIHRRSTHIDEAVRYELALLPQIIAPMGKLVVALQNSEHNHIVHETTHLESVVTMRVEAAESILLSDYQDFRAHLLDAVRVGVAKVEAAFDWSAQPLYTILDDIGQREQVFHYNLSRLTKRDRKSRRSVEVWFDIDETAAWLTARVREQNGQVVREQELARALPSPLEFFFPLRSAIIVDGVYVLRDKKRQTLAEVRL